MAIEISLNGVNISGNSKLLTNSTIKGGNGDVKVKLTDTTLADTATFLDSTLIDQSSEPQNRQFEKTSEAPASGREKFLESLKRGAASFGRDILVNLTADKISEKF